MQLRHLLTVLLTAFGSIAFEAGPARSEPLSGHPPIGAFDVANPLPDRGIRVSGWAIDPDTAAPIGIHIYVDGALVAGTVADRARYDVGYAYPGYTELHGYEAVLADVGVGVHTICVYAIDSGTDANALLGCKGLETGGLPFGSLDLALTQPGPAFRLSGWAIDPDTAAPIGIHTYVDGVLVDQSYADRSRVDVGFLHLGYGALHGFDVTIPAAAGSHTVCSYAIDHGRPSPTGSTIYDGNPLLGCRRLTVGGAPFGALDLAESRPDHGIRVSGWAIDPDTAAPIGIHIYVDGALVAGTVADRARYDVGYAYPGYTELHGYDHTITGLTVGVHTVCAYALDADADGNSPLGCKLAAA